MEQALWVGYGLLVALSWVLGLGALRAALRRNGVLDWGLAAVALAAGGVGCPLSFLPSLITLPPALRSHVVAVGIAGIGLGSIALYLVNWRYFRPKSVIAALVCTLGSFVIAWSFLAEVLTAGFAWGRDRLWLGLGGTACWIPYAWGATEMLLEAARRGRHATAGRGESEAAQTLFLYGLAQAAVALVFPPGLLSAYQSGGGAHSPLLVSVVAVVAVAAALAAALAFSARPRRRPDGAQGGGRAP